MVGQACEGEHAGGASRGKHVGGHAGVNKQERQAGASKQGQACRRDMQDMQGQARRSEHEGVNMQKGTCMQVKACRGGQAGVNKQE